MFIRLSKISWNLNLILGCGLSSNIGRFYFLPSTLEQHFLPLCHIHSGITALTSYFLYIHLINSQLCEILSFKHQRSWADQKTYCNDQNLEFVAVETYDEDLAIFQAWGGEQRNSFFVFKLIWNR